MNHTRHHASKLWRVFSWVFVIALLCLGIYILATALSPQIQSLPVVQKQAERAIRRELDASAPSARTNHLYIPKIGVSIDIVTGKDETALLRGAWHRKPENGDPKNGGNFVLSAHRFDMGFTPQGTLKKSPFYHIDRLEKGDTMSVDYSGTRYEYVVTRKYRVAPTKASIENRTDSPVLTLYSCTLRGSADGRDVIEAKLKT